MIKLFTDFSAKLSPDLLNVLNAKSAPVENKHLQIISSNANVKLISCGETCEFAGDLKCIIDAHTSLSLFLKENYNVESDILHLEERQKIRKHNKVLENSSNSDLQVNQPLCDDSGLIDIKTEPEENNTNSCARPDPIVFSFRLNGSTNNYESELSPHSLREPQKTQEVDSAKVSREITLKESEEAGEELINNPYTEIKDTKEELSELLQGKSENKINSVKRIKRHIQVTTKMKDYLTHRDKKTRKITLKAPVTITKEMQPTDSSEMDVEYKVTDDERDNHLDDETDTYTCNDDDDDEWDTHLQSDHDEDDSDYIPDESENTFEIDKPVMKKQMEKIIKESSSKIKSKLHVNQNSETKNRNLHEEIMKSTEDTYISDWFCEKCDTYFPSKIKWKNHSKTHQPQTFEERIGVQPIDEKAKDIPCPEVTCKHVAREKRRLIEHYFRIHGVKNLQCSHCDTKFSLVQDLMRHQKIHRAPQHYCQQCGKFYKITKVYLEHLKSHEENYIKQKFTCETCGKSLSTKYALNSHVKSEHLGFKKSYLCPTCGKSFTKRYLYVRHTNAHLGIRPYVCEICGNSFTDARSLKEHKYLHDEVKRFKCDTCGKCFRQSTSLQTHQKIHKGVRDYECEICGKSFTQVQALSRHKRIHTGDKPFTCAICGRTFNDSSIIRRHMILVHKKDPKEWKSGVKSEVPKHPIGKNKRYRYN